MLPLSHPSWYPPVVLRLMVAILHCQSCVVYEKSGRSPYQLSRFRKHQRWCRISAVQTFRFVICWAVLDHHNVELEGKRGKNSLHSDLGYSVLQNCFSTKLHPASFPPTKASKGIGFFGTLGGNMIHYFLVHPTNSFTKVEVHRYSMI